MKLAENTFLVQYLCATAGIEPATMQSIPDALAH